MENEIFLTERKKLDILAKSKDFAKYKSKRASLENYRKILKARLMKESLASGVTSNQAQEREAYAHPQYEQIIDALEIATRQETELYWELKIFDIEVQVWRTQQANKRNDI
jgi:hypothetical protein